MGEPSKTAAQDLLPFHQKLAYGAGAFINNTLAAAIGGMMIVLNLGLGMNPALVGLLGAIPRLFDAIIDPIVGYMSDHTRSRWGRRRPFIFWGAITSGITFALLWQLPVARSETFVFWYFLIGSLIFYVAYAFFATPWVALGYELTPDYHERTRLMGVQNFLGQLAYMVSPWFLWIMSKKEWFDDQISGAAALAILIGAIAAVVGVLPALLLHERFQQAPAEPESTMTLRASVLDFFHGFKTTISSRPFLKLCAATFLVFNGFILISSFQFYVIIYYVFGGDQELGAEYAGYAGTLGAVSTFLVIFIVTWLGTRFGKRKAFVVSTLISMVGYGLKLFAYNPAMPLLILLPAPLMAFGLGGLFTLMPSMIADVVDLDELSTHQRREGMYGSIFWWVVKLGMAVALAGGGVLLNVTGFDVELAGQQSASAILLMRLCDALIPIATSLLAIWAVMTYGVTEESALEVRKTLEARRGSGAAPA